MNPPFVKNRRKTRRFRCQRRVRLWSRLRDAEPATTTPQVSLTAPAKAATLEYGRYLAEGVYQCGDCHTPGFDADKVHGPDAFISLQVATPRRASAQQSRRPSRPPIRSNPSSGSVARWIRNPEQFRPGTVMPSFASVLDEPSALALAEWLQKTPL